MHGKPGGIENISLLNVHRKKLIHLRRLLSEKVRFVVVFLQNFPFRPFVDVFTCRCICICFCICMTEERHGWLSTAFTVGGRVMRRGAVIDKRLSKKYGTTQLRNTGEQVEKYGTTYSGEIQGSSHRQEAGYGSVRKVIKLPISPHRTRPSYVPTKTSDAIYPLKPPETIFA